MTPRTAALVRAVQIYTDASLSEGQALAVLQQVDAVTSHDVLSMTLFHEDRSADRVNEALRRAREP